MCGIAGMVGERWRGSFAAALASLRARGPDAENTLELGELVLGHQRLAVIDLETGGQPMRSADGRYAIVFNGEIYNFRELRAELERAGRRFETHSDTEVLLAAYAEWGERMLDRLDGMFAFALWDALERGLFAARDRIGIKPFFYSIAGGGFAFASTLAAFLAIEDFPRRLDPEALRDVLAFQAVLAPRSMLQDVRQLAPASCLNFDARDARLSVRRYWEIPAPGAAPAEDAERVARVEEALEESVRRQLVADVPIGVFLSGGVDSGLLAYYMARAGARPLRSFNIRFREEQFDETPHALAVARHLGTEHQVIDAPEIGGDALLAAIAVLDQPLGDPAYVTTKELSRLTRGAVTVAISGDGADELFAGYPRFREIESDYPDSALRRLGRALVRRGLAPGAFLRRALAGRERLLYGRVELGPFDPSRKGLGRYLQPDLLARAHPEATLQGWLELAASRGGRIDTAGLMRADLWTYLSEDCLVKTDRASMAHGLEVRVPFLGNPVLDLVLGWPAAVHFDASGGKALLRSIARRVLPETAWNRPKHGFSVPVRQLLNGAWSEAADDYFARAGRIAPFLRADSVERLLHDARRGRASRRLAYTMLVLLVWLEQHRITLG